MYRFDEDDVSDSCSREGTGEVECRGELFLRVSRSGLTSSTICEGHADELESALDAVAERYPEVNHHDGCGCHGCTGNEYSNPYEAAW